MEKGLKLSITEGGREGKSMVIASCSFLEEKFLECCKREGAGLGKVWEGQSHCVVQLHMRIGARRSC